MKKLIVAAVIVAVFTLYSLLHAQSSAVALAPQATTTPRTTPSASDTSTPTPASSGNGGGTATATATSTSAAASPYKDGSYLGSVADAQWGYIQVRAIIKGGKITDVQFVQYPNERDRSVMINSYADPQLTSEAIQAQSANVDIVTGATDTSEAFIQSLTDALSQAQG